MSLKRDVAQLQFMRRQAATHAAEPVVHMFCENRVDAAGCTVTGVTEAVCPVRNRQQGR